MERQNGWPLRAHGSVGTGPATSQFIAAHRMMGVMAGYMAAYGLRLTDSSHQIQAFGAPGDYIGQLPQTTWA